jgi:hypothetical protein
MALAKLAELVEGQVAYPAPRPSSSSHINSNASRPVK